MIFSKWLFLLKILPLTKKKKKVKCPRRSSVDLLAHRLSGLEEALAAEITLARVAGLARPAAALSVADPRVPVAVRTRTLECAEHVGAFAQRVTVVHLGAAAFIEICVRRTYTNDKLNVLNETIARVNSILNTLIVL